MQIQEYAMNIEAPWNMYNIKVFISLEIKQKKMKTEFVELWSDSRKGRWNKEKSRAWNKNKIKRQYQQRQQQQHRIQY